MTVFRFSYPIVIGIFAGIVFFKLVTPALVSAGLTQADVHKAGKPKIPEMGGIAILAAISTSVLLIATLDNKTAMLAVVCTVLITGLIGLLDDVVGIGQAVKAFLPMIAALPLSLIISSTTVLIPFVGVVDIWVVGYLLLLLAIVTVAPNVINMVGGFNGTELGMGIAVTVPLAVIAYLIGANDALVPLMILLGVCLAALRFNWFPSRVFLGDVGSFAIGGTLAAAIVIGHLEVAGVILLIPFVVDMALKLPHKLPKTFARLEDGKLYCPQGYPIGLAQLILKATGGLREDKLAMTMIGIELVFGGIAIMLYVTGVVS